MCKRADRTKSYNNRFNVHWKIGGRQSCRVALCGSTYNKNGHRGGECCWGRSITIHKGVSGNTTIHIGVGNGKSKLKGDGNGEVWIKSCSEEKTHNPGHSYTFGER
jgi:hypothetical protein